MAEQPQWLEYDEQNDLWIATLRGKQYKFKEISGKEIERAQKISQKNNKSLQGVIAAKSLVEPEMSETDVEDLPGSIYMKINYAMQFVYELDDFQ